MKDEKRQNTINPKVRVLLSFINSSFYVNPSIPFSWCTALCASAVATSHGCCSKLSTTSRCASVNLRASSKNWQCKKVFGHVDTFVTSWIINQFRVPCSHFCCSAIITTSSHQRPLVCAHHFSHTKNGCFKITFWIILSWYQTTHVVRSFPLIDTGFKLLTDRISSWSQICFHPSFAVRLGETNINSQSVTPTPHLSIHQSACPRILLALFISVWFRIRSPCTYKCIGPSAESNNPSIIGLFIHPSWGLCVCLPGTANKQRVATPSWNLSARDKRRTCASGVQTTTNLNFHVNVGWNIIPMLFWLDLLVQQKWHGTIVCPDNWRQQRLFLICLEWIREQTVNTDRQGELLSK